MDMWKDIFTKLLVLCTLLLKSLFLNTKETGLQSEATRMLLLNGTSAPTVLKKPNASKLLIETSSKSIIVIEDIDCSLDLTGQRKERKKESKEDENDPLKKMEKEEMGPKNKGSEVTLSGLLNFIDGLWSACGSERLVVFTTNHIEKLDPALIRRGRMDMHIELSYCSFEAFKVLANNYMDLKSHELFETVGTLLKETKMTPADIAEHLMRKTAKENPEIRLTKLINALNDAKEETRLKDIEAARIETDAELTKKREQTGEKVQDIVRDRKNVDPDANTLQITDTAENSVITH